MSRPARRLPAAIPVYRVALVSGANRGLGFEVARQLSERGMTVLLGARDLDKGLHAARQLTGAPGEVIAVQLDVTQQEQVDTLARWIDVTYGRLDVLVNNAGAYYDPGANPASTEIASVREAMDTHVRQLAAFQRHAIADAPASLWPHRQCLQRLRRQHQRQRQLPGVSRLQVGAEHLYARPGPRTRGQRHPGQCGLPRLGRHRHGWPG